MTQLTLACDFGSSLARGIYSVDAQTPKPELVLMEPEAIELPVSSIINYEESTIGTPLPENSAWIYYNESYHAIGHLARAQFKAERSLDALKIDAALRTTLAMVGVIAEARKLPDAFGLTLGILLPWGEYKDRDRFKTAIAEALLSFKFKRRSLAVTLERFVCLPEGAGLFARGRVPLGSGAKLANPQDVAIAIAIVGYRDASILFINRGQLQWGKTKALGCQWMVNEISARTSGQQPEALLSVLCQPGRPNRKTLSSLVRTRVAALRDMELDAIAKAVADTRQEYIAILSNWLRQNMPGETDEIVINGGTAKHFKPELSSFFKSLPSSPSVNWCEQIDERVRRAFGTQVAKWGLDSRLSDVYGLFYNLYNRPLPRLKDLEVIPREEGNERHVS